MHAVSERFVHNGTFPLTDAEKGLTMRLHTALIAALATLTLVTGVHAQTLDKVKSSGTITLAYRESSIPFSYLGGDGQPVGFAWEICNKIVDQVKKPPAAPI